MSMTVRIGDRVVGEGRPTYIVAEVGINHNGDLDIAKSLIGIARKAGVDAVKFQKRTPELCVPPEQRDRMRETPWGYITYLDYRYKVEFNEEQYREIDRTCREAGIPWFVSVWDEPSVDMMEKFNLPCYKVPSAHLTNNGLLKRLRRTGRPILLSTGMSSMEQIQAAVKLLGRDNLIVFQATSCYPCDVNELNLRVIPNLREALEVPVGYSGHEVGLIPTVVAVALGACMVERHITLDRALWGSDQASSVEPQGLERLVRYIRVSEQALGDGVKRVFDSELPSMRRLRRDTDS